MADSNLKFRQTTSGAHGSAGRADCLPRRKPPACIGVRQLCRKKIRCWGLGTPTTAGESRQLQCPKVPKVRTESPLVRPQAHTPCWGMTRRLRRGLGLAVLWGAHTFLSMAKEKGAKESQRHGDSRGGPRRYSPWASVCGSPSGCPRPRLAALTRREKAL